MTDAIVPPGRPRLDYGGSDRQASRRAELRVAGPFDGRRVGPLPTPLRIHDLSAGGCLIECYYDVAVGRRINLQIELPGEGWITLDAETVHLRNNFGFAVRFVGLSAANRGRIERTMERLLVERSGGWLLGSREMRSG
jgi:PilZ domain-containing protein